MKRTVGLVTVAAILLCVLGGVGCLKSIDRGLTEEKIQGEMTPVMPYGWWVFGRVDGQEAFDYYSGYDSEVVRGGKRSMSVIGVSVTSDDQARITQRFSAIEYRGKRVRFSGYIKTNQVGEWAGFWMRIDTDTKQAYAFDDMEDRPITGTADWTEGDVVLDVPENAVVIYLGAHMYGRGQIWVDDCAFEIVGNDVETTDRHRLQGGYDRQFAVPDFLRDEPVNLGFEELEDGF
jgi:hypothetical protein